MPSAVPVSRQWVIVLNNGNVVIDWGDSVFQDLISGEFLTAVDQTGCHSILDEECDWLEKSSCIQKYDGAQIYVYGLPEQHKSFID